MGNGFLFSLKTELVTDSLKDNLNKGLKKRWYFFGCLVSTMISNCYNIASEKGPKVTLLQLIG